MLIPAWTEVALVDGEGSTNILSVQTGPTTSTNALAFQTYWGGFDTVAGLIVIPPSAASGSTTGLTGVSGIIPIVITGASSNPVVNLQTPLGPSYGGTGLVSPGPSLNVLTSDGAGFWHSAPVTPAAITTINSQTGPAFTIAGAHYIGVSTLTNQAEIINLGIQTVTGPSYTASNTGIVFTGPNVLQTAPNTFLHQCCGRGGRRRRRAHAPFARSSYRFRGYGTSPAAPQSIGS